jgi:hypothetical protein
MSYYYLLLLSEEITTFLAARILTQNPGYDLMERSFAS